MIFRSFNLCFGWVALVTLIGGAPLLFDFLNSIYYESEFLAFIDGSVVFFFATMAGSAWVDYLFSGNESLPIGYRISSFAMPFVLVTLGGIYRINLEPSWLQEEVLIYLVTVTTYIYVIVMKTIEFHLILDNQNE